MKRDTLVLVVAVLCGLAAFSLILNFLKQASQPKAQYVITRAEIAAGSILKPEDLTLSEPLANIPVSQHYTQMYEVIGMEALQDLPQNHLVGRADLKKPEIKVVAAPSVVPEVKDIVLPVPEGLRALTLDMQEMENIPNNLKGGDYIDILGTIIFGNNQKEVKTILRGVLVLSAQKSQDQKQIMSFSVALHPTQVETILNASKFGKMRLVITQKPTDNTIWSGMGSIEVIRGIQRERKVT
jgi:Flp pilus assembly protein CpaB